MTKRIENKQEYSYVSMNESGRHFFFPTLQAFIKNNYIRICVSNVMP